MACGIACDSFSGNWMAGNDRVRSLPASCARNCAWCHDTPACAAAACAWFNSSLGASPALTRFPAICACCLRMSTCCCHSAAWVCSRCQANHSRNRLRPASWRASPSAYSARATLAAPMPSSMATLLSRRNGRSSATSHSFRFCPVLTILRCDEPARRLNS